jgi:hypothetical protein
LFHDFQGGQYILTLVDFYGANFTVFILGTIEVIGIAWIYGELCMAKVSLIRDSDMSTNISYL